MSTDLADLMERATVTIPVDTRRLINGGVARAVAHRRRVRRRIGSAAAGVVGFAALASVVVPSLAWQYEPGRERSPYTSLPPASTLELLPDEELAARFTDLLPGTTDGLTPSHVNGPVDVMFEGLLTNDLGQTGEVMSDFAVGPALPADAVAQNQEMCQDLQRKVGPRDGTSCVLVQGGMIMTWDDTVPPEDPGDDAPGVRLAWVHMTTWDGGSAVVRALNTTENTVAPEPGAVPVVRTDDLVDLVQQMEWYRQK